MSAWLFEVGGTFVPIQTGWTMQLTSSGQNRFVGKFYSKDGSFRPALDATLLVLERVNIQSIAAGNPTVITTVEPHGLVSGRPIGLGSVVGNTPNLNGFYTCTVVSPTTFSIPVNTTAAGAGGWAQRQVFYGDIITPQESAPGTEGIVPIVTQVTAIALDGRAAHRYVNEVLVAGTLLSQLTTLAAHYLPGIVVAPDQTAGPPMPAMPCAYVLLRDVLDAMAQLAHGYVWEIDPYGYLRMFLPSSVDAPFNIVQGDRNAIGDVTAVPTRTNYANRVILEFTSAAIAAYAFLSGTANFTDTETVVIGSKTYTLQATLTNADGHVQIGADLNTTLGNLVAAINLAGGAGSSYAAAMTQHSQVYALQTSPGGVKVTALTAGAAGNSVGVSTTAAHATWSGEGNTPLSSLALGADAALTSTVTADNGPEQTAHNIWETVVAAPEITSYDLALAAAQAELAQTILVPKTVTYKTGGRGLQPGQQQTINFPARHINGVFLITDVNGGNPQENLIQWTVTAVESLVPNAAPQWRDVYKQWSSGGGSVSAITAAVAVGPGGGTGGGGVAGSGTIGHLAAWMAATTLGDGPIAADVILATGSYPNPPWLTTIGLDKLAPIAAQTLLGNNGASAAVPSALNAAAARGVLGLATTDAPTFAGLLLTANAIVGGSLHAGASTLASLTVTGNTTLSTLTTTGLANLAGLAVTGNATVAGALGSPNYVPQMTGWQITAAGAADVRYLFADELHTRAFIADLEQALAGGQIISKSVAKVATTANGGFRVGTDTQLVVESFAGFATAAVFQNGDTVRLRSFARAAGALTVTDAFGTVTLDATYGAGGYDAGTMTQAFTFTKTSGSNIVANTGTLALDYGVSGNGYYEVTAIDGAWGAAAPYAQVVTWSGSPSTLTVRTRLGNLAGLFTAGEYGLFAGDLAGKRYLRASSAGVELHGLDFLLWDGTINTFKLNHAVPSFAMGNPVPTGYGTGTGTGMWMGKDTDGVYKFRVGTPGSAGMFWDGTALTITGVSGGALTGIPAGGAASDVNTYSTTINGGKITTGSITTDKLLVTSPGAALNEDPTFLDLTQWGVYQGVRNGGNSGHGAYIFTSSTPSGSYCQVTSNQFIAIDKSKTYRISAWVVKDAGNNGLCGIGVIEYDNNKTLIQGTRTDFPTAQIATGFTFFSINNAPFQAGTVYVQLYAILNNTGTTGQQSIANLRLEEMAPSTLIQDGAITTNKVAANAITANKLFIGNDQALNDDPSCGDASAWTLDHAGIQQSSFGSPTCFMSTGPYSQPGGAGQKTIPVSANKTYRYHCYGLRSSDANGVLYVGLYYFDYLGTQLTYNYPCASAVTPGSAAWGTYEGVVNVANGFMPSTTTTVRLFFYLNYGGTAGWMAITDIRFEEMSPSTLIQDGAITTAKIFAGAVTAGTIAASTITTTQIAASTITGGNIAGSTITGGNIAGRTITAGNIATGTLTANEIAAGTITATQIAARSITADRIVTRALTANEIQAGAITANEIQANSITADRLSVGSLSAISANLGNITAGTINAVTINGSTVAGGTVTGGSGTITLNSTGLHFSGAGGSAIIDMNGVTITHSGDANNGIHISNALIVDGLVQIGTGLSAAGFGVYFPGITTAGGTQVGVTGAGQLVRVSSSVRYKENIRAWQPCATLLRARPIVFDYIGADRDMLGFSAEDLHALDPQLVNLDAAGRPESLRIEAMLAHLLVAVQSLHAKDAA